jgi:hypothetical protein
MIIEGRFIPKEGARKVIIGVNGDDLHPPPLFLFPFGIIELMG